MCLCIQKGAKMVDPCSFRYDEDSPPMAPFCPLEREVSCVTDDDMLKLELMTCDDSEDECSSSINHTVIKITEAAIENRSPLPEVLPEDVPFKDSSNTEGNVEEGKVFSNPSTVEVNERACNFINGTHEESDLFHGLELQEKKILNINTNTTMTEESSVKLLSKSEGLKREQANFSEQQKEVKEKGIEADLSPLDGDIEECGSWAMDLTELFKGSSNEECNKQEALQKNSVKTCQKSNTVEEKLLFETVDKTSDSYIVHQKKDLVFDEKKDLLILLLLEPIPTNSIQDRFCKLRKLMNKNTFLEWPHDEA
ncbi:Toll-like receptor 2 [Acipenser ruthenus]|uniref:Toll-like receptor 2 n=1 Tax=Acipenser ruthenus TaxID=7906 RepID=A0A444TZJ4_ACIRT|nr:Toll-like receptor 2 [Acipenser ruthenus]